MKVTKTDIATALARGTLGAIPVVGSLVSEVVGMLIPNQRLDRIEALMIELARRIGDHDDHQVRERFTTPEFIDLLEDGIQQSAKALSNERIERIAALLANGLLDAELAHLQDKRMLELLGQVNDAELILLQSHTREARFDGDWLERHQHIVQPPDATMGSSQSELDGAVLHDQFKEHLAQMGLLEGRIHMNRDDSAPEFDRQTGRTKISYYDLTHLGRLLLRRVGLVPDGGF